LDPNEEVDRPGGMLVTVTILLITASWVSYLAPIAIHNFGDTFLAFASLPVPARYLLTRPHVWQNFLLLAVPLFIWVIARSRLTRRELGRMKLAMRALIVAMLLAYGLAGWAIYTV
jgi:hypothetical protein